ncbi:hypothetical protein R6Q57_013000 [Mikania cordata]
MDITSPPPTAATTTITGSPVKDPDPDDRIPKQVPPAFTNGVLKRHKPQHHYNPPPVVVSYKECLKNHAASMGGHAVDGCGEFMPSPASSPTDPTSIKCAACGCHRNFHRRDPDVSFPVQHVIEYQSHHRHHPPPPPQPISIAGVRETSVTSADSPSPPPISSSYYPSAPHMLLALSSGVSVPPPETTIPISGGAIGANSSGKKRFRTKFTQDQKEKMHELAERVGWKMQKKDEDLIIGFCHEIGVDKGVFKVWMHNNKMTFGGKKDSGHLQIESGSSGGGFDFLMNRNSHQQQLPLNNDSNSGGGGNIGTNGSSSSS